MSLITLTTDFGYADWFVGSMKGVIANINPKASIIDITHGIPAGDIRAGGFALMAACRFFPPKTIHVAVVDPGVGTKRAAIAVETGRFVFVGPDNGLLSWALRDESIKRIHRLENRKFFLPELSNTFHGRDLFAPVAAHLSRRIKLTELGPKQSNLIRLPWPERRRFKDAIEGEVLYIDHFGNAITNISSTDLADSDSAKLNVRVNTHIISGLSRSYQDGSTDAPLAIISSSGFLEIAINGASAAAELGLQIGTPVRVSTAMK
jgi:S-adenosylmethionine hydrolase